MTNGGHASVPWPRALVRSGAAGSTSMVRKKDFQGVVADSREPRWPRCWHWTGMPQRAPFHEDTSWLLRVSTPRIRAPSKHDEDHLARPERQQQQQNATTFGMTSTPVCVPRLIGSVNEVAVLPIASPSCRFPRLVCADGRSPRMPALAKEKKKERRQDTRTQA